MLAEDARLVTTVVLFKPFCHNIRSAKTPEEQLILRQLNSGTDALLPQRAAAAATGAPPRPRRGAPICGRPK
jgi:hypothetical protein